MKLKEISDENLLTAWEIYENILDEKIDEQDDAYKLIEETFNNIEVELESRNYEFIEDEHEWMKQNPYNNKPDRYRLLKINQEPLEDKELLDIWHNAFEQLIDLDEQNKKGSRIYNIIIENQRMAEKELIKRQWHLQDPIQGIWIRDEDETKFSHPNENQNNLPQLTNQQLINIWHNAFEALEITNINKLHQPNNPAHNILHTNKNMAEKELMKRGFDITNDKNWKPVWKKFRHPEKKSHPEIPPTKQQNIEELTKEELITLVYKLQEQQKQIYNASLQLLDIIIKDIQLQEEIKQLKKETNQRRPAEARTTSYYDNKYPRTRL
jgi:hypothetical protein